MAISGDLKVSAATLGSRQAHHPLRSSLAASSSKVNFAGFQNGGPNPKPEITPKWPSVMLDNHRPCGLSKRDSTVTRAFNQETESFLLSAINMNLLDRLNLAWKIVFPSRNSRNNSNANIAKQRLRMILFSDRCAVSDEAKQKIVANIVHALSDFVEIESQDKVQLTVSTDTDLGTIYSVTVPVRRVKQEYQDAEDVGSIMNVEYKDNGDRSGSVDVTFDFFMPDENAPSY